jgi:hypothetical protein
MAICDTNIKGQDAQGIIAETHFDVSFGGPVV